METSQLQQYFFQHLKSLLPSHLSLVDEVATLLNISIDSAYRRIRNEKSLSFEEIQILAAHFKISLDQVLHLKSDAFIFTGRITNNTDFTFENWLQSVIQNLQAILSYKPNHLFYLAKELPFFYYFLNPEVAAFKSFFFMKSILYYEDWKHAKFSVQDELYKKYFDTYKKISDLFATIPSTEIWSIENITSTLHQIEFYRVTGSLKSDEEALILFDKIEDIVNHLERQAEQGVKLHAGQATNSSGPAYKMFVNELIMGDNMQLVTLGSAQVTYINHSVINFILTRDEAFNTYMKKTLENIAQKSTPVSEVNEKERLLFFNRLRTKIYHAKKQVTATPVYA